MAWRQTSIQLRDRSAHLIIDDRFAAAAPVAQLPILNWFGIWFVGEPTADEFIPKDDEKEFQRAESLLIEACDRRANGWAVYCFKLISRGLAEYYLYSREQSTLASVVGDLAIAFPERRFDHDTKTDKQWLEYGKYLNVVGKDGPA